MLQKLKHAVEVNAINDYLLSQSVNAINDYLFPKSIVDISALKCNEVKEICTRFIEYECNADEEAIQSKLLEVTSEKEELSEASIANNYNSQFYTRSRMILRSDNVHKKEKRRSEKRKKKMQDRVTAMKRRDIVEIKYIRKIFKISNCMNKTTLKEERGNE